MEAVNQKIQTDLYELSSLLQSTLEKFVMVSEETKDNKLKMALRGCAVETWQYEHELNSHLQSLGLKEIDYSGSVRFEELLQNSHSVAKPSTDQEISEVCHISETSLGKAYEKVLNESLLNANLRSMLIYQWKGIKYSFMKVKLLNSIQ